MKRVIHVSPAFCQFDDRRLTRLESPMADVMTTRGMVRYFEWLKNESTRFAKHDVDVKIEANSKGLIALYKLP